MSEPERTALYRFFDADSQLLYVGITNNPEVRWYRHARDAAWWPSVVRKTVEWHPSRLEAVTAEAVAIVSEKPRWNVAQPNLEDPLRSAGGAKSPGRPATGQTRMMSFRPPSDVRQPFEALALSGGYSYSDALVEAMHDWVQKKRRADTPPLP